MKEHKANKDALSRLAAIAPVVRGLLGEQTGSDDIPYSPVILNCFADKKAIDFASGSEEMQGRTWSASLKKIGKPPLFADLSGFLENAEKIKEELRSLIDAYQEKNNSKPDAVCLKNLGILIVSQPPGNNIKNPLHNKVALVTGAAGAIGYGVCKALLENGCRVAATDLAGEKLDDFVKDLRTSVPERVIGVALDVTDENSVRSGFQTAIQTWGGVDIVVINAGIALVSKLKELDLEAFRNLERVNVEGTLLTIAEASRLLIAQGTGGDIVIMSTKNVPSPSAGFGGYSATKAACHQLGRIASLELAEYGIRVNMVAPDAVFSEGKYKSGLWQEVGADRMKVRGMTEEELHEYYRKRNLLKARVTGRHVANAVLFFVTHKTPTTGATIPVDGGLPDATPR